jgi:hypothetical protein
VSGSSPSHVNRTWACCLMATSTQTSKQRSINEDQPLKKFFSRYSRFQYRPQNSPIAEFDRLCKAYRWEQDGAEENHARYEFNIAMKREFDALYGSDEKDINNWYKLCHVVRIDPVPKTLKKCRAVSAPLRGSFDFSFLVPGCLKETC